mmetsp:Transcript_30304/g.22506  ORF Transcript_30304/g.22506 Transcript_30304/m.22506 type:complete len:86 (+) Transcript_30304:1160-1417(+)
MRKLLFKQRVRKGNKSVFSFLKHKEHSDDTFDESELEAEEYEESDEEVIKEKEFKKKLTGEQLRRLIREKYKNYRRSENMIVLNG